MKAIVALSKEEFTHFQTIQNSLYSKIQGHNMDELITYTRRSGYAHYKFEGMYTDKLVELLGREPLPNEIIMLVDGGFSHFGAECHISGHTFSGKVNTD